MTHRGRGLEFPKTFWVFVEEYGRYQYNGKVKRIRATTVRPKDGVKSAEYVLVKSHPPQVSAESLGEESL